MPRVLILAVLSGAAIAAGSPTAFAQDTPTSAVVVKTDRDATWTEDVLTSKLFLGPTARSLKRGEGYLAIDSFLLPMAQVGVTDRFSIGVGAPVYGALKAAWITPKVQLYRGPRTAVATGVLHLMLPRYGRGGYGYVVVSQGGPDAAVTVGGGVIYAGDKQHHLATEPVFTIGGARRVARRRAVITENYIFRSGVMTSVGVRFIGQRVSSELGGIVPIVGGGIWPPGVFFNLVFHSRPTGR